MTNLDMKAIKEQQKWRKRHPLLWRILLGLLITGSAIIVLLCALFIFLSTQAGRNYVSSQIQEYTHNQVQIQGLSSIFSKKLTIADVRFKDPNGGVWLDAQQIQLNWSPWKFVRDKKIVFRSLIAKEMNINALPSKRAVINLSKDKQEPIPLAYVVDIQNIQINKLFISSAITKIDMTVSVNGKMMIRDLGKMIDTETLKKVLQTQPQLHLLHSKKLPDFQFNGKINKSITGKVHGNISLPLHFSVILPQQKNDNAEIYLDLGEDN